MRPGFRLLANAADITDMIAERLSSLTMTDEAGFESDTISIILDDGEADNPIALPPTGAELELFLGYDGEAKRMGLFIVDEIEMSGGSAVPSTMAISGRAAPFDKSKGGKVNLQTQKTRSWAADTTIGAMVAKIAGEHGMEGAASASLANVKLPHTDQSDESDMHLLVRIARRYDGIVKPAGGKLIMAKRGEARSVGGEELPEITIEPGGAALWSLNLAKREESGSVVAAWHVPKKAKRHTVTVGEGEPVTRIRRQFTNAEQARAAAQAEMDRRQRAKEKFSVTIEGNPDAAAEAPLITRGFRDGVNGEWIITRVTHSLDGSGGYVSQIECEKPGDVAGHNIAEDEE
ncbi:MAG: phage tail protein [Sphingopyxis macrogoltabida]|uniref:Phage tail protein n=1 Tax=Sphingopyxis macrogoltabida TaxID=33050 RepID=A0A2W5MTZ0_SPHMC|nr:MAG: phage tail protein [Sphingopyxis macrogoltabida]